MDKKIKINPSKEINPPEKHLEIQTPGKQVEIQPLEKHPEIKLPTDPEEPLMPEEDPDFIPGKEDQETPPYDSPPTGEGP